MYDVFKCPHVCKFRKKYYIYHWGSNLTECLIAYTSRTFSDALVLTGYIWGKISRRPPFLYRTSLGTPLTVRQVMHGIVFYVQYLGAHHAQKHVDYHYLQYPIIGINTLKRRQNETPCNRVFQMYFRQWKMYDRDEDFIMISFPWVQLAIIQRINNGLVLNRHLAII